MYAVIEAGGKQHKVELGQVLEVDLMQEESGVDHAFENVMLYVDGDDVQIGQPYIENAKVVAEIVEEVKGEKVSILRFRRRKHSMRKIGHRQKYTQIKIKEINVGKEKWHIRKQVVPVKTAEIPIPRDWVSSVLAAKL